MDADAVPAAVSIVMAGAGDREFLLVPSPQTDLAYAQAFASWSKSAALGAVFHYLDGGANEIALASPGAVPTGQPGEIAFAVVRWARASRTPFPTAVHCLQRVSLGERALLEIVPAAGSTEGAQR
ncbi:hypothetical protein ACXET9_09320 [Brachybacterium sp. DNPG3]